MVYFPTFWCVTTIVLPAVTSRKWCAFKPALGWLIACRWRLSACQAYPGETIFSGMALQIELQSMIAEVERTRILPIIVHNAR